MAILAATICPLPGVTPGVVWEKHLRASLDWINGVTPVLDARCKRCGHRFPLSNDRSGRMPECLNCRIPYEVAPFGEREWLAETDPNPMLSCFHGKVSDRKLRLFIANYCRRIWHLFQDERCRKAIEVAERFADGQVSDEELLQVYVEMWTIQSHSLCPAREATVADSCRRAVRSSGRITPRIVGIAAERLARAVAEGTGESERGAWEAERRVQVDTLRDIFGNPFRPVVFDPRWTTPTVTSLAQAAYAERLLPSGQLDVVRLAVLGDALEDAGCTDPEVLGHLRSPGPHFRGCWPLDLLL